MNTKEIVLKILDSADNLLVQNKYVEAFHEYEQIIPIVSLLHSKSNRADSIGSFVGWTSGFLTGGLGFEDIFIIPLVSKSVSKVLGSDLDYISQLLSMTLMRQINCILSSNNLLQNLEKEKVLQKFALLHISSQSPKVFYEISKAILPGLFDSDPLSNQDVLYTPYYYLLGEARNLSITDKEIFFLLYNYLVKINDRSELFQILKEFFPNNEFSGSQNESSTFYASVNVEEYYDILGVKKESSKGDIKRAYHEKMKQYHPDKFAHLSPEFQELANEKAKLINEAFNYLINKD